MGRDDAVTAIALVRVNDMLALLFMLTVMKFFSLVQSILVSADVSAGYGRTIQDLSNEERANVLRVCIAH